MDVPNTCDWLAEPEPTEVDDGDDQDSVLKNDSENVTQKLTKPYFTGRKLNSLVAKPAGHSVFLKCPAAGKLGPCFGFLFPPRLFDPERSFCFRYSSAKYHLVERRQAYFTKHWDGEV